MEIHFTRLLKIKRAPNQNSGVRFDSIDDNGQKDTYYGYIEEICVSVLNFKNLDLAKIRHRNLD